MTSFKDYPKETYDHKKPWYEWTKEQLAKKDAWKQKIEKEIRVLAKEIKEQITNGWSDHEKSHFNDFLKEEIEPYWPVLYAFLVENLGEEEKK
jgi:hypothetical protein